MLKGLNLTDEQQVKVKELKKEYRPKFKAAIDSVLTADQTKARDDAVKTAKDAGKKGPEVFKAARAAVKLTDDQDTKLKEVMKPLHKEVHEKLMAILTPEQREQLTQKCEKHKDCK
jgi:Spy/CpxP family protein refolding chaperone